MCLTFANDDHSVNRPPKDYLIEILSHSYNNPNVIVRYSLLPPPPPLPLHYLLLVLVCDVVCFHYLF